MCVQADDTTPAPNPEYPKVVELAKRFIGRSEKLGYKGKARDKAALDFFCGALALAEAIDTPLVGVLGNNVFLISIRGFAHVKEMAEKAS
jgi:hypothetical protein